MNAAWEIDLWGRIRRSSEAARAQYLATDEARRGVMITLVSQVATAYFQLLQLDQELEIQRAATNAYAGSYRIFNDRLFNGVASKLETDRAAAALANAAAAIPQLEIQIATTEDQLNVLLGRNPGPIVRNSLTNQPQLTPEIPAGLPSELLRRRPDVLAVRTIVDRRQCEHRRERGEFLSADRPDHIFRQGKSGTVRVHRRRGQLVESWAARWPVRFFKAEHCAPNIARRRRNLTQAKAAYQQTVLTSFQEVSDALITRQKLAEEYVYDGQAVGGAGGIRGSGHAALSERQVQLL